MSDLAVQYAAFVFVAACGVLQIAAAYAGLGGILVLDGRKTSAILGGTWLLAAFGWFFGTGDRNVRGLEGLEQAFLFSVASMLAVMATLLVSSLLRHQRRLLALLLGRGHSVPAWAPEGLETLRKMTFLEAMVYRRVRRRRKA